MNSTGERGYRMGKITPFLWFETQAGEAADFYTSIFKNSRVIERSEGPDGAVRSVTFELYGLRLTAFNAGPEFKFNEAISLFVDCETQAEVDDLWSKLSAGGEEGRCGWLKDRYGLSWQVIPNALPSMLSDPDPVKAGRVRDAMLEMGKIDIAALERAYEA